MPVGLPNPHLWIQASNGAVLTFWAIRTAPMFEDTLRIWLVL